MTALIIVLVILLAPIVGCLIAGLDRKITAKLQQRVGPPLLQPLYDFLKLMNKENVIVNPSQFFYIFFYLVFVITSLVMLVLQIDLLMIIFVYTIANVALIVGSSSTGSPYARIGAQRETFAMLAYEPVLIFFIVGMYMLTGTFNIAGLDNAKMPLFLYMPLIYIAMLFIMSIKFKKSPFDFSTSHHAHQELVKGMFTEFSGPSLAMIEFTHWYEYVFLLGLMFLFWKESIIMGLVLAVVAFLFVLVLDNISARITWQWMLRFSVTLLMVISVINLVVIYIGKFKIV